MMWMSGNLIGRSPRVIPVRETAVSADCEPPKHPHYTPEWKGQIMIKESGGMSGWGSKQDWAFHEWWERNLLGLELHKGIRWKRQSNLSKTESKIGMSIFCTEESANWCDSVHFFFGTLIGEVRSRSPDKRTCFTAPVNIHESQKHESETKAISSVSASCQSILIPAFWNFTAARTEKLE